MADLARPLPNPPADDGKTGKAKDHSRRVSFSDKITTIVDSPSRRRRCTCGCQCCIWTWIIILSFLLLIALTAVLIMAVFEPRVPDVRVEQLSIRKMDFAEVSGQLQVAAELNILFATANANTKIGFALDNIVVSVSSFYTGLGQNTLPAFELGPGNVAIKQVLIKEPLLQLDKEIWKKIKEGIERKDLMLVVEISCVAKAKIQGWLSKSLPVLIRCNELHWPQTAEGFEKKCQSCHNMLTEGAPGTSCFQSS
ncbi:hypothetical protein ACLOJK_031510 [Asimina triloba]